MVDPDTSGWQTVLNCTKSLGSGGRNGDGQLTLTSVASGEMQASTVATYPVVSGTTYQVFADAASANQAERIGIQWLDNSRTQVGLTWSPTSNAASSSWHRVGVAGPCPVGATLARVVVSATTTASAKTHFFENVYLGPPITTTGNLFSFNVESGGEIDTSGWAVDTNATIARDTPVVVWPVNWYLSGANTIKMTVTANGNASIKTAEQPAVVAGTEYKGDLYINPPTSGAACWVEMRWYNAGNTLISSKRATLVQPSTGVFRQTVSGIAPTGAVSVVLATGITSATAGQILRVEGAVITVSPPLLAGSVVPYEDASFEQGIGQWTVGSGVATIARTTPWGTAFNEGAYSLTVTSSTATTSTLVSGRYPVTPGLSWRAQVRVQPTAGTWQVAPTIHWYDSGGTSISRSSPAADPIPSSTTWWRDWNDITAPVNAATAAVEVDLTAPSAGATLRMDSVVLLPTLPAFTATADDDLGLVTLVLRELDTGDDLTLYRVVGGQQSLVRGPDGWVNNFTLISDELTYEDYEAPLGVPVYYRRETYDTTTGDLSGTGSTSAVTLSVPDPSDCWIKDVLQPQRNVRLRASVAPDWTRPIEQTEYRVRGRRNSVILSDVRGGLTGTLKVWTESDDDRAALHFALDTGNVLLFQFQPGLGLDDLYASVGQADEPRFVPYGGEPLRQWALPLTESDAPIGGVGGTAGWTVQDVATTWDTVTDLSAAYATVLDLVLDQRTS
jgi:hypothetical protein